MISFLWNIIKRKEHSLKKCSDCKYFVLNEFDPKYSKCSRKPTIDRELNPITGEWEILTSLSFCTNERKSWFPCKPKAKFWEPKC